MSAMWTQPGLIKREVSDGVIAPGYDPDALELLKQKKKGNYNIIEIDPDYVPAALEHKQVYGITFEQGRNELNIDKDFFSNVVTENKEIPESAKIDLAISMITLKYTQSNSVCYVKGRTGDRDWSGTAVTYPLYTSGRSEGGQLVAAPESEGARPSVQGRNPPCRP